MGLLTYDNFQSRGYWYLSQSYWSSRIKKCILYHLPRINYNKTEPSSTKKSD